MAGAPKGNKNAKKLTSDELKREAYEQYCAHLAKGKDKKSWYFDHPDMQLTWKTMEKYIAEDPIVFPPDKKEMAYSQGYQHWEGIAEGLADGSNKQACVPALQMVMRNKFKWDRADERFDRDGFKPQVTKLLEIWSD